MATLGSAPSSGALPIANGGTGAATAGAAINALLPSQAGNSGKYLNTDGSGVAWATGTSGASSGAGVLYIPIAGYISSAAPTDCSNPAASASTAMYSRHGFLWEPTSYRATISAVYLEVNGTTSGATGYACLKYYVSSNNWPTITTLDIPNGPVSSNPMALSRSASILESMPANATNVYFGYNHGDTLYIQMARLLVVF